MAREALAYISGIREWGWSQIQATTRQTCLFTYISRCCAALYTVLYCTRTRCRLLQKYVTNIVWFPYRYFGVVFFKKAFLERKFVEKLFFLNLGYCGTKKPHQSESKQQRPITD
jgi:hypothetical protein